MTLRRVWYANLTFAAALLVLGLSADREKNATSALSAVRSIPRLDHIEELHDLIARHNRSWIGTVREAASEFHTEALRLGIVRRVAPNSIENIERSLFNFRDTIALTRTPSVSATVDLLQSLHGDLELYEPASLAVAIGKQLPAGCVSCAVGLMGGGVGPPSVTLVVGNVPGFPSKVVVDLGNLPRLALAQDLRALLRTDLLQDFEKNKRVRGDVWPRNESVTQHLLRDGAFRSQVGEYWSTIRNMSTSTAVDFLANEKQAALSSVIVMGLAIPRDLATTGGPAIALVLMVYFALHLKNAQRILLHKQSALDDFPWVPIFSGLPGISAAFASVCVLPTAAISAMLWQSQSLGEGEEQVARLTGVNTSTVLFALAFFCSLYNFALIVGIRGLTRKSFRTGGNRHPALRVRLSRSSASLQSRRSNRSRRHRT